MRRIEYEIDGYKVYEFLDINRHNIKKFWKTNRNKELNSFLRDKLASLIRKMYSKKKFNKIFIFNFRFLGINMIFTYKTEY